MKRFIVLVGILFLFSCGKKSVRSSGYEFPKIHYGELPKEVLPKNIDETEMKKEIPPLQKAYLSFYLHPARSFSDVDDELIQAFRGERFAENLDRNVELRKSFDLYTNLILKYPTEKAFLALRAGKTLLKLKDWNRSSRYLYQAYIDGDRSSELFYALSLVQKYKEHDLKKALVTALQVDPTQLWTSAQDYEVYLAELYADLGNLEQAKITYHKAVVRNPERFFVRYDLLPFYVEHKDFEDAKKYLKQSYDYLMSLTNQAFHKKAVSQKIYLNRANGEETFEYAFNLSDRFIHHPNLLYYLPSMHIQKRILSSGLSLPVKETKEKRWDKIYYNLMEDIWNNGNASSFVLLEALPSHTNMKSDFAKTGSSIKKLYFYNPVFIQILPTNDVWISTNTNGMSEGEFELVTNENHLIWMTNLQINHLIHISKMAVDEDQTWDYLAVGIVASNEVSFTFILPKTQTCITKNVWIDTPNARLVVQDIDQNGKKDWYLLDQGVSLLNPPMSP